MKRPLALIGLSAMLVLTVCFYADFWWLSLLFGLSLLGLLITLIVKKLRQKPEFPVFFAVVLVTVIGFNMFTQFCVKPVQKEFSGKAAEVTAVLLDEPEIDGEHYFYTLKTQSINDSKVKLKLNLHTVCQINCNVGDTLTFTTELESADYGKYLADKVYLRAYTYENVKVNEAEKRPLYYYIVKLRQNIRGAIYLKLDADTADLASAVLLGDNNFSDETYEVLRRAGLTHVVVVSGLHLSIITMLYTKLFGGFIRNKYINILCTVLIVLFFLCLTGFGKSSIRAAVMLFVLIAAGLFKREGDSLNSLGFAAILLCLYNPYIVGDVGVLLSFCATFGIVVFSTPLYNFLTKNLAPVQESYHKRLNKLLRFFLELFATTFAAVVCTLPVNVLFFGKVSLVQIFSNLFVLPLVQWFMLFSVFSVVFSSLIPFASDIPGFFAELFGKAMLCIAKLFASIPMAYVKADYTFVIMWLIAVAMLFAVAYFIRQSGRGLRLICTIMSVLIFVSGVLGHIIASQNKATVYISPAKSGQSIVLSSKDGNVLLCSTDDFGAITDTEQILESLYTEKQLLVASSENIDEYDLSLFDYQDVLMYDKISKSDCRISLWDKAVLIVTERKGSVYQYLSFSNTSVLILPSLGDAEDIPEDMRSADVLITSGLIDNMELLSFETLISNGSDFKASAVIDFFRNRGSNAVSVSDTIDFDIVG